MSGIVCTRCERELSGGEPEGLCPACLLASMLSSDDGFVKEDLPEDSCESYRPERSNASSMTDSHHHASVDESAAPPYTIEGTIGVGGSGEVFCAVQSSLNRRVAVKRLHFRQMNRNAAMAARRLDDFRREAVITGRLDHPNIVPVYDLGTDADGQPFLAMKLIDGTPWSQVLREDAEQDYDVRLRKHIPILMEICRAVSFAHSRGVIHRDLKPSQVIIGRFGEVLLTDWGLAVTFHCDGGTVKLDDEPVPNPAGTAAFMAWEQTLSTPEHLGPWTDIYLLGGILYYVLTLTPPHNQPSAQDAFDAAAAGMLERPEDRASNLVVPPELSVICMKALQRDPEKRYASVDEFSNAIHEFLAGAASRSESASLTEKAAELYCASTGNYNSLLACDKLLQAACDACPANSNAAALQQEVLTRLVQLAISRGDFGIAEMQIQRVADEAVAQSLSTCMQKEQKLRARRATQGRLLWSVLGLLVLVAVTFAGYVWRASVRNVKMEADRLLAQRQIENEKQRAELFDSINHLRSEETSLTEELTRQLPYPAKLLYKDDAFGVTEQQRAAINLLFLQSVPLAKLRAELTKQNAPLEPEPFALVSARARLALHEAKTPQQGLVAYELAMAAAHSRRTAYEARLMLGIAAARSGYFTSATLHLRDAGVLAQRQFTESAPEMRQIAELYDEAFAQSAHVVPAGAVIIGSSLTGAEETSHYREISGRWFDSISCSCAPGLSAKSAGRGCRLRECPTTNPAVLRFTVPRSAPREAFVYVTWGPSANVSRAMYAVHHGKGSSTVCLTENGFGTPDQLPFHGNGNLWIPLGRFTFAHDLKSCVEVRADVDSGMPDTRHDHRLYVDAVMFSPVALTQGVGVTPHSGEIGADVPAAPLNVSDMLASASASSKGEYLVESHPLGMNSDCYSELCGSWSAAVPGVFGKSQAPGLTTAFKCGTRRVQLPSDGHDAVARFRVPAGAPEKVGVYVTWSKTANAYPVKYRIRYAEGEREFALKQLGSVAGGTICDTWVSLGEFSFTGQQSQGVEVIVPSNADAISSAAPGIAFADAVLFAKTPPSDAVAWNESR